MANNEPDVIVGALHRALSDAVIALDFVDDEELLRLAIGTLRLCADVARPRSRCDGPDRELAAVGTALDDLRAPRMASDVEMSHSDRARCLSTRLAWRGDRLIRADGTHWTVEETGDGLALVRCEVLP